jgi:hypothetical protein
MDALAREFGGQAHFLFIYVREAHPDRFPDHPAHRLFEQKLQHARDLQAKFDTPRMILLDGLDGEVHRAWGGLPNMSWVLDHTGRVTFKAGWTSATDVHQALESAIRLRKLKREGITTAYYKESVSYVREEWGRRVDQFGAREPGDPLPSPQSAG